MGREMKPDGGSESLVLQSDMFQQLRASESQPTDRNVQYEMGKNAIAERTRFSVGACVDTLHGRVAASSMWAPCVNAAS